MKKIVIILFFLISIGGFIFAFRLLPPFSTPEKFFKITKSGRILHYDTRGGSNVVVPNKINGIEVTSIGKFAFAKLPIQISIVAPPQKTTYGIGETFDISGLAVSADYEGRTESYLPSYEELDITGFDSSVETTSQVITVEYRQRIATFSINIKKG